MPSSRLPDCPENWDDAKRIASAADLPRNQTGKRRVVVVARERKGRTMTTVTRQEAEQGIDLTRFAELSTNQRSREVGKLALERERLLGLAWLTDVGHKRPDTPKGEPLAAAQKKAAALEERMQELARPRDVVLQLRKK